MHRSDFVVAIAAIANVPLAILGVFVFVRDPSLMAVTALLILEVGPLAALAFVIRYRGAVKHAGPPPHKYLRAFAITWNPAILVGMVVPFMMKNPPERAALLAPVGAIALFNIAVALFPRSLLGRKRREEPDSAAA